MINKYGIDYSRTKAEGNYLYLSEKPCSDIINRHRQEKKKFNVKEDYCMDDFIHFMDEEDIKTVVILLTDTQIDEFYGRSLERTYQKEGFKTIHYPIRDFSVPSSFKTYHKLIQEIVSSLKKDNVLIHCSAGWGRTGLVAAGVATLKGHDPSKAIELTRKIRPGSIETQQQELFVMKYGQYIDLNETMQAAFT